MRIRIEWLDHKKQSEIFAGIVARLFRLKKYFFRCKNINYPEKNPVILACYHGHQLGIYAYLQAGNKLNVMVSKSKDGDIIAAGCEAVGLRTIRGSQSRGGAGATLKSLDKLKAGESVAITVDGPRGPKGVVKKGVIEIAKLSGVPIVPFSWHSESLGFVRFKKSWDNLAYPINGIPTLGLYGDPIYVPEDADDNTVELYRQKLELELKIQEEKAIKNYKELMKSKTK